MFVECVFYTLCYDYFGVFGPNGREMGGGGDSYAIHFSTPLCGVLLYQPTFNA